jgi:drug/metabolite transporter (DMT)-like permease
MTRQAWLLFAAMSVIWGIPYLLIKVAVGELSPAAVAGSRTLLAAVVLLPLAAHLGALRPALRAWRWVVAFGLLEMDGPWLLLGRAETRVSSGFAGLMIATVPIVGVLIARLRGDRNAFAPVRLRGLGVGILGVVALVGIDSLSGQVDVVSVVELLLVAVGYAVAPVIANTVLAPVPAIGVIAVSVTVVAAGFLPWTVAGYAGGLPSAEVVWSILGLGLVCTALAFVLFFRLIALAGPVRATVITFINPAVAIMLGILVLAEPLTWGMVLGFPLVLLGAYWATRAVGPGPVGGAAPEGDEAGVRPAPGRPGSPGRGPAAG